MNFFVGLLLVIFGVLILKYRYMIYNFTGDWDWAQKYLGANGTVVAISLFGAFLIFIGVAFPLGAFKSDKPRPSTQVQQSSESSTPNPFQDIMNQPNSPK